MHHLIIMETKSRTNTVLIQAPRFVPTLVNALSGYEVVEVATGKAHALFLTACGKVLPFKADENRFLMFLM